MLIRSDRSRLQDTPFRRYSKKQSNGKTHMPEDTPFSLALANEPRFCATAPRLLTLVFTRKDPGVTRLQLRETLNFGVILAAGFPDAHYTVNGVEVSASIPALICTRPGWRCQQTNPDLCEKLFFIYDRAELAHFPAFPDEPRTVLQPLPASRTLHEILDEILRVGRNYGTPGDADRLDLLCQRLLTEFVLARQKTQRSSSPEHKRIHEMALYLDLHYAGSVDVGRLIRRSGVPERTFNRRWREQYGVSPLAYLLRRRIEAACRLLHETDGKMYEIAQECGFADPYYFSRIFRKYTGVSPLRYRRLHS